jgi:hypothetical protein
MEALTEEEIIELTDTNTFAKKKSDQFIRAQEVAIFLEQEAGPNLCRLQRAYAAGYRMKEAEPLPPIVQGLIDGQGNQIKQLREMAIWRVDEPPKNKKIELLCVLFDEDEYRTLKKNEWSDGYNRFIVTGTWNGAYFRGEISHASGDPFPKVVAWRPMEEPNLGAPFYTKCLGECRD